MFLLCVYYNYCILHTDCVKGLGIFPDHKNTSIIIMIIYFLMV
jgi:hypothetical protein